MQAKLRFFTFYNKENEGYYFNVDFGVRRFEIDITYFVMVVLDKFNKRSDGLNTSLRGA